MANLPDVLKVPEIAKYLRVTASHVYALIHKGNLRAYRIGQTNRGLRVAKEDLRTFLGQNATTDEQQPRVVANL
jgi:excisionase family DNA binding protein